MRSGKVRWYVKIRARRINKLLTGGTQVSLARIPFKYAHQSTKFVIVDYRNVYPELASLYGIDEETLT